MKRDDSVYLGKLEELMENEKAAYDVFNEANAVLWQEKLNHAETPETRKKMEDAYAQVCVALVALSAEIGEHKIAE